MVANSLVWEEVPVRPYARGRTGPNQGTSPVTLFGLFTAELSTRDVFVSVSCEFDRLYPVACAREERERRGEF